VAPATETAQAAGTKEAPDTATAQPAGTKVAAVSARAAATAARARPAAIAARPVSAPAVGIAARAVDVQEVVTPAVDRVGMTETTAAVATRSARARVPDGTPGLRQERIVRPAVVSRAVRAAADIRVGELAPTEGRAPTPARSVRVSVGPVATTDLGAAAAFSGPTVPGRVHRKARPGLSGVGSLEPVAVTEADQRIPAVVQTEDDRAPDTRAVASPPVAARGATTTRSRDRAGLGARQQPDSGVT
jgi:hypothetical protein